MRNACKQVLYDLVREDSSVMLLTADGHDMYQELSPEYHSQFVDYGIAESNMVASAAGLASCGKIPFLFAVTNFMAMRAFEFIRDMVCIPSYNVKFLGFFSGLSRGAWGATHHGTEDLTLLRCLPNLLVITPATPIEAHEAVKFAYRYQGPVYIRLESSNEVELYDQEYEFALGKGHVLRTGYDITVVAMGSVINEAIQASDFLRNKGISVRVIDLSMIKPLDEKLILSAASETNHIITLEEHSIYGGLGSALAEFLLEHKARTSFIRMGLDGIARGCGNQKEMREINHLSANDIVQKVHQLLE